MHQIIKKKQLMILPAVVLLMAFLWIVAAFHYTGANTNAQEVAVDSIDYEKMEARILYNDNQIIYFSTDNKTWHEAEGVNVTTSKGNALQYDISWNTSKKETTIYFRGNSNTKTATLVIPAYNTTFKAKFDKAEGGIEFSNMEGATVVRWRKTTDYTWHYVNVDASVTTPPTVTIGGSSVTPQSYNDFVAELDNLRVKGAKIHCQTAPSDWVDVNNPGMRPSKEVKVTISAKKSAPSVKVNVKKMTVNTKTTQEWLTKEEWEKKAQWHACSKNMKVSDLAPDAVKESGRKDVTIYVRTEATSSNAASKIAILEIPQRDGIPTSPASLVLTAGKQAGKGKANLTFTSVPAQGYQYYIQKSGGSFDETAVSWKTVKKAKTIKLSESKAPKGSVIYIRVAGVAQNVNKGIALQLPSECSSLTVGDYPAPAA